MDATIFLFRSFPWLSPSTSSGYATLTVSLDCGHNPQDHILNALGPRFQGKNASQKGSKGNMVPSSLAISPVFDPLTGG